MTSPRFTRPFRLDRPSDPRELTAYLLRLGSITNHVNADEWQGHAAGTLLCTQVDAWFHDGEAKLQVVPAGSGWPTATFREVLG